MASRDDSIYTTTPTCSGCRCTFPSLGDYNYHSCIAKGIQTVCARCKSTFPTRKKYQGHLPGCSARLNVQMEGNSSLVPPAETPVKQEELTAPGTVSTSGGFAISHALASTAPKLPTTQASSSQYTSAGVKRTFDQIGAGSGIQLPPTYPSTPALTLSAQPLRATTRDATVMFEPAFKKPVTGASSPFATGQQSQNAYVFGRPSMMGQHQGSGIFSLNTSKSSFQTASTQPQNFPHQAQPASSAGPSFPWISDPPSSASPEPHSLLKQPVPLCPLVTAATALPTQSTEATNQKNTLNTQSPVNVVGAESISANSGGPPNKDGDNVDDGSTTVGPITYGDCVGTKFRAYLPVEERWFGSLLSQYQAISMQRPYEAFSFEELRVADYIEDRKSRIGNNCKDNPGTELVLYKKCAPAKRGYRAIGPLLDSTAITLHVGKASGTVKDFIVMKQHLVSVSPYFEGILNTESASDSTSTNDLELDDVAPGIFGIFFEWLLSRMHLNRNCEELSSTDGFTDILLTYVFAQKYDVPQLRRDAIDAFGRMKGMSNSLPCLGDIKTAYTELPDTSPMLRLIVDMYATSWFPDASGSEKGLETLHESMPSRFAIDLAFNMRRRMLRSKTEWVWNPCSYHHE